MSKDTYDVQRGERRTPRRDTSYGSFLCAILIFLILCIIITIVGNWSNITRTHEKKGQHDNLRDYPSQPSIPTSATTTTQSSKDTHKTTPPVHHTTRISTRTTSHSPKDTHVDIHPTPPTRSSDEEMTPTRMDEQHPTESGSTTKAETPFLTSSSSESTNQGTTGTENIKLKPVPPITIPVDRVSESTSQDWSTESNSVSGFTTKAETPFLTSSSSESANQGTTETENIKLEPIPPITIPVDRVSESTSQDWSTESNSVSGFTTKAETPFLTSSSSESANQGTTETENIKLKPIPPITIPVDRVSESTSQDWSTESNSVSGFTTKAETPFLTSSSSESASTTGRNEMEDVCSTSECKSVGARMLSLMDDSQDACEDFHAFACGSGSFPSPSGNPADSGEWDILLEQTMQINGRSPHLVAFRSFYDRCVEFHYQLSYKERINKVKEILKNYGIDTFELANACDNNHIFKTLLSLNLMYFFEVGVEGQSASSDTAYLSLGPSLESSGKIGPWSALRANQKRCLSDQRRKIYDPDLNLEEMQSSYTDCLGKHTEFHHLVKDAAREFGFDKHPDVLYKTTMYLEKLLTVRPTEHDKQAKEGKLYSIQVIQQLFPAINWANIFSKWLQDNNKPNKFVKVYDLNYLTRWFEAFSIIQEQKWLLINMLITDLYYNFVVHNDIEDVERQCIKTTSSIFGDIASNLYLKHFSNSFIEKQGERVNEQFGLLKTKLTESFNTINEHENAKTHLKNLRLVFTNSKYVPSDQELEVKYKNLPIYATYPEFLLVAKNFTKYETLSQMVNAFDNKPILSSEIIFIPLGMVADIPLDSPKYVTASKIGLKLAQAIIQTFSNLGFINFMNEDYHDKLVAISDSLSSYMDKKLKFKVKLTDNLTTKQRISDNSALRLLTDTYPVMKDDIVVPWISSNLSKDQVMFLSVAQEFCRKESALDYMIALREGGKLPGAMRIYDMVMNSESFAKNFGCAVGPGMNENLPRAQLPYFQVNLNHEVDSQ